MHDSSFIRDSSFIQTFTIVLLWRLLRLLPEPLRCLHLRLVRQLMRLHLQLRVV